MSKSEFWTRLAFYILFGAIIPIVFLIVRFNLFTQIDSISIGGWGIVVIIFACVFFIGLMKKIEKGLPFSLMSQIVTGLGKVIIPLVAAAFIVYYMQDCMKEIFQFLLVCTCSELVAIVVNPLPKWAHENKIEQDKATLSSILESLKK